MEHYLFRRIAEIYIIETHIAPQLRICYAAVIIALLPCPYMSTLLAFAETAVLIFSGVDESYLSIITFRFFVKQRKDTVSSCQTHYDHVYLVGYLAYRSCKLFCHVQERYDDAYAERHSGDAYIRHIRKQERSSYQRNDYIHYISYVAQKRHEDVCKTVAVSCIIKYLAVYSVKIFSCLVLMAEHLDDLLPGHHFFHKSLSLCQCNLLPQEECG